MADVSTKMKAVADMEANWRLVDDLNGGTSAMRSAGEKYMPRWPMEDRQDYDARVKVATLFPAYSETIATMTGRVFAKPLQVGEDVPEGIAGNILSNVDLEGRNIHVFGRDWFESALNYGLCHVLVDYPRTEAARTKADELASGARPYLVQIKPAQVLGWRSQKLAGVEQLVQFRFQEAVTEVDGEFGEKVVEQIRVLEPGRCRLYRKNKDGVWALHDDFATSLPSIPLVTLYANRTGFMQGKPPLLELAHLNVKHWQSQSDQDTILHTARVPLLARIGAEQRYDDNGQPAADMQIGKSLIDLPAGGDLKYVEHGGAAIQAGQESLAALEEQMKTAGAKLLTKTVLSMAESQAKDEKAKEVSQLGMMAQNLEDSLDRVLDYCAKWMGLGDDGGHLGVEADLDADNAPAQTMEVLLKMVVASTLSNETAFNEAKRRGLVSDDLDWATEQERITNQAPVTP